MTEYIVQGRRFQKRLHAVTFAQSLAAEQGVSVDVDVEVIDEIRQVRRSWACRMHPPGKQVSVKFGLPQKQPPLKIAAAR